MWGNFIKSAAALASEQAQSIVGNASQFLERLDGIGATMEDEDGQQDSATEVGSDKASDVDGPMGNVSVSTTSPIDPNLRSSIDLEPVALKHETADLSTVDESLSQSFVAEQNVPVITPTPKKNTKSTLSAKPPLSRTPEPAVHQSSDSLEALETASKPMDVKKYQSKIRKLEKEKNELEQQTCDLQLSVASLSKELQFALTEKLSHDAQHSEERQDFLDQIAALKEDQEKAENQFATQLAAVKEQYQHELTRVCAEYETKIGDLKAKFQAQEEELLVLQLKKDHQRKKDEDHAELENKLRELTGQCKRMLESYQTLQQSHDDVSARYEELSIEHSNKAEQVRSLQDLYDDKVQEFEELRSSMASQPSSRYSNGELQTAQESYEHLREQYEVMESEYNALTSRAEQDRASMVQLMDQLRDQECRNDDLIARLTNFQEQLHDQTQRTEQLISENSQLYDKVSSQERVCQDLRLQLEDLSAHHQHESKQPPAAVEENVVIAKPSGKPAGKKNKKGGKKRGGHEIYSINIGTSDVNEGNADFDGESETVQVDEAQDVEEKGVNSEELQTKMTSLEMECQDLLSKLDELVDKHQGLQDKYDNKESDYHMLIEELNKKESENNSLYHQFEKISRDYSILIDQHKELAQKQSQFDHNVGEEAENMKHAFEELQRQHAEYIDKLRVLEETHSTTLDSYTTLQDELYSLKFEQASSLKDNEEQLAEYQHNLSNLQNELNRFIEQIKERDQHIVQLTEELKTEKAAIREQESVERTNLNTQLTDAKVSLSRAIVSQQDLQEHYEQVLRQQGELKEQRDMLDSELAVQRDRVTELEEANKTLQSESAGLREQCDAWKESSRALQEKIRDMESSIDVGGEKLAAIEAQYKCLQVEHLKAQEVLLETRKECDELKERCSELDLIVATTSQDLKKHEVLASAYEVKMQQLMSELDHSKKQYEAAARARQQADSNQATFERELGEARHALGEARSKIETIEAEHQGVQSFLQELVCQKKELQAEVSAAKQALQQQIVQCDKLSGECADAQERLQLITAQFQEAKKQASSQYSALQLQHSQAQEGLRQAQSEIAMLQGQSAVIEKKNLKLEQDNLYINQQYMNLMSQSGNEVAGLKECINSLERDKAHALSQYQQSQLERTDLQRKISQLEGELEKFQQQVQGVDNKKKKDLEALKKQNELINSLQQKIFSLEQQLASSTVVSASSTSQTISVEEHLMLQEKLTSVQGDFGTLQVKSQEQIGQLEQQLQNLTVQIDILTADKRSLEQQMEGMERQANDLNVAYYKARKVGEEKVAELNTIISKHQANQQTTKRDEVIDEAAEKVKKLQAQVDTLGREKKEMQQQIEELSQHLTNAYEQGRQVNISNVTSHSTASSPANTFDEELGIMSLEREKKASIGSQVYVVQGWNLIRQNCPGALIHHLPDRPPRLSVAAQVAIVYGLLLQIVVVYQYRSCT